MEVKHTVETLKELVEAKLDAQKESFKQQRELIDGLAKQISELQQSRSVVQGESNAEVASRINTRWLIALIVTIILAALGFFLKK